MKKKKLSLNDVVMISAFLGVVLVGAILNSRFLSIQNILSVFQQMSEMGIMTLGLTVVILIGGIDLSCGSIMGLCAVVSGICLTSGISTFLVIIISLSIAVIAGICNGFFVAVIRIPPMIATLGTQMLLFGLALILSKGNSISGIPQSFYFLGQSKIVGIPIQAHIFILTWLVLIVLLKKKKFGKSLYILGNNEKAAKYSGIQTVKVTIYAYVICAVLSAIAGNIQVSRVATARADMGSTFIMQCISAIVLGGTSMNGGIGGVTGSVIGIMIFAMIGNIMNLVGITSFWQQLATGSILIIVIVFNRIIEMRKMKVK